jgi:flagellar hook-length control protein FliK
MLQQLAGAIAQAIESDGAAPLASAADSTLVARQPVGHEPLRIFKIALEPAELGHVTVRLRLTGQTLELRVSADRAETASLLDRDRHLLSRILEASGYSAGDVTVQLTTPAPQPGTLTARATGETQAGAEAAPQFQSNGSADGERYPSRSQGGHGHSRQEAERDEQDIDPRRRGDLYV